MVVMAMSDEEILSKYRRADNKKEMLQIIAELNVCTREEMRDWMLDHGVSEEELPPKRGRKAKTKTMEEIKTALEISLPTEEGKKQEDAALSIPIPVRQAILEKLEALDSKIHEMEKEWKCLSDFMEGRADEAS